MSVSDNTQVQGVGYKFCVIRTVHIRTIEISTKKVLNKTQFMTSITLLFRQRGAILGEIFRTKEYKTNRPVPKHVGV
jgi:hypothetical protein